MIVFADIKDFFFNLRGGTENMILRAGFLIDQSFLAKLLIRGFPNIIEGRGTPK
jgi:hypothetical protein